MDDTVVAIIGIVASSTLLAAIASNWQRVRQHRKEMVAGATRSALKRVEMYYRVVRRQKDKSDDVKLRDQFHEIQEENSYYVALLSIEAPWLGSSYKYFIEALQGELQSFMHAAWNNEAEGAGTKLAAKTMPDVAKFTAQFTKDSKRLFNPIMRTLMRIRFALRRLFKENSYEKK